jgi:cyclic pyranopterin phosphate synthase
MTESDQLTHIMADGAVAMVDVSAKETTHRVATACARVKMAHATLKAIKEASLKKGEAIGTARIAGIMASKKTSELIPLCHSLPLNFVEIQFQYEDSGILITATASTNAKTGVEMEALTACTVAALTIYDMAKAVDRSMEISDIRLLHKSGGRSGEYNARD